MSSTCEICKEVFENLVDFTKYAEDINKHIEVSQWLFVNKHFEQVPIQSTVQSAIHELKKQAPPFFLLSFNQKTSQAYFQEKLKECTEENIVLQIDFAENYTCLLPE